MVMNRAKGQMKIQQMAFMLIAVMMFFALVGLLIVTVRFSGLKDQATTLAEENAMLLVSKLSNSPEFSCGEALGTGTNCVDSDKVISLKENIEKYEDFWGVSNIEIRKISESSIECNSQNYPDCEVIKLLPGEREGVYVENFVSLCRKDFDFENQRIYDKCELAKIFVSYKEVQ